MLGSESTSAISILCDLTTSIYFIDIYTNITTRIEAKTEESIRKQNMACSRMICLVLS